MDPIDALELSWKQSTELIWAAQPGCLSRPTPCAGWDVRTLLSHVLEEAVMMTRVNGGRSAFTDDHRDLVGDGSSLRTLWEKVACDNVASWRHADRGGDRTYVYGTFPAAAAILINLGEVVLHSWDLAQAMGCDHVVDPDLATLVYDLYRAVPLDALRADGIFGPEVVVPISAPIADRLLGLLGRSAMTASSGTSAAVARSETAETFQIGDDSIRLLLDADATAGAISAHRVCLTDGALGANPHRHTLSSEAFYVLDGSVDLLVGEERICAGSGDLVVVPPGEVHAFAASRGATAEVLVFITPGVKRFELFRQIARIRAGQGDDGELSRMQSEVDTYAMDTPRWRNAR